MTRCAIFHPPSSILAFALALALCALPGRAADRPPGVDEKLWSLLVQIDARSAKVKDLTADFTQEKFTPLLKKPLLSTGTIRIKGPTSLWNTRQPEPTILRVDEKSIKLLYPRQKVLEVYATDQRMGALAASPFPRLDVLSKHFTFEQIPTKDLGVQTTDGSHIALRMRPTDAQLKEHIDEVSVLLEVATGYVKKAQTIDPDGDRIVLSFANIRANTGLSDADLALDVPPGVSVTHPLEGDQQGKDK
ncbi:MAG TPA: outer membrane lipoprotein carrier protein LolA [Tepidisphaeraceae bacterium]|jgi:outer membrane lipoprotein-sorting protein